MSVLDDTLRALAALVTGSDQPLMPAFSLGVIVGHFTTAEAVDWQDFVRAHVAGRTTSTVDPDGTLRLHVAA